MDVETVLAHKGKQLRTLHRIIGDVLWSIRTEKDSNLPILYRVEYRKRCTAFSMENGEDFI